MTEEQKKLYQYLYSIAENEVYKDCLRKQKKSCIEKQKDSDFMEYSLVEAHLKRISERNNDRTVPIDIQTLEEFNLKTGSNVEKATILYGAYSDALTRVYHANALTIGATIYFTTKAYKPETEDGRKTLAHELIHVQQMMLHCGERKINIHGMKKLIVKRWKKFLLWYMEICLIMVELQRWIIIKKLN